MSVARGPIAGDTAEPASALSATSPQSAAHGALIDQVRASEHSDSPAGWRITHTPMPDPTPPAKDAYVLVEHSQPHPERARTIVDRHPEVRALFGPSWLSGALIVAIVVMQLVIAYAIRDAGWFYILLAALFFGAYADHALWVLVHECAHYLCTRNRVGNRILALVANLVMVLPCTVTFCIYHLKHHKYLGNKHHDADIAPRWEAWLLRHGWWGRLLWQCLYPFTQGIRTLSLERKGRSEPWARWIPANFVVVILFDLALWYFCGRHTFRYLILSTFFSIGPHPLGARWIQEHYVFRSGQETYSYYGLLNIVSLNIGYHNEHHDLPQVAWFRLPRLKRIAPEMYDGLYAHYSLTRLWLRFLFDRDLQLYRIGRDQSQFPTPAADTR